MSIEQSIWQLLEKNNGYLKASDAVAVGISRVTLGKYSKKLSLESVGRGIYIAPDVLPDALYILQMTNKNACFSHETALYLHGLMEREPFDIHVTVPTGYNASHLRKKGVHVYQRKAESYAIGQTETDTHLGNRVVLYDMERTICDIVQNKGNMDAQIFQTALREYVRQQDKNIPLLMRYARQLCLDKKIRQYLDVLL